MPMPPLRDDLPRLAVALLVAFGTLCVYLARYSIEDFTGPDLLPFAVSLTVSTGALYLLVTRPLRRFAPSTASFALLNVVACTAVAALFLTARVRLLENLPLGEGLLFGALIAAAAAIFGLSTALARRRMLVRAAVLLVAAATTLSVLPPAMVRLDEALAADATAGHVRHTAPMQQRRAGHTATPLHDGRVLMAGGMESARGVEQPTASTEIFDPRREVFEPGPPMHVARAGHTATVLENGDVLVTGGIDASNAVASAEVLRLREGRFERVGSMRIARERHAAARLADGRVLVVGGTIAAPSHVAEAFDPAIGAFRDIAPLATARSGLTATALPDGSVIVAGGVAADGRVSGSVERFDADAGRFVPAGTLGVARYKHAARVLDAQRILFVGGADERDFDGRRRSAEIFDVHGGHTVATMPLNRARFKIPDAVAMADDGAVIVAGAGRRVEVLAPSAHGFAVAAGTLSREWFYATATPLPGGRLLIAGGYDDGIEPTAGAWIFERPAGARHVAVARR